MPYDSGSAFGSAVRAQLAEAANAVNLCGADLSAEDASELQAKYGFLIAPALRDLRRLELMPIPADAPCTDAEQLAAFADYYCAEDYFVAVIPKTAENSAPEQSDTVVSAPFDKEEWLRENPNILYNPDKDEYYDSDYYIWDPETKSYQYVDRWEQLRRQQAEEAYQEPESLEPAQFTGVIPAEFRNAATQYQQTGTAEDFAVLTDYAAEHPALIAELSTTQNDYTDLAQQIVHTMLGVDVYPNENPAVFRDNLQQMYTQATLALLDLGRNNLSAAQVQELQRTYGCMVAPAIRTYWHMLEMLQIPADAPCTDAEKLADLAECFAP